MLGNDNSRTQIESLTKRQAAPKVKGGVMGSHSIIRRVQIPIESDPRWYLFGGASALLYATLLTSLVTLAFAHTTMLQGTVHLMRFLSYLFTGLKIRETTRIGSVQV